MNKKFLSAILLGALMVAATGTFVSCKDYDDDIENLQSQITANANAISQINSLISSGSVITGVTSSGTGIVITLSNGNSYTITNGNDGADAVVWTIGTDGYWYQDGVKSDYKAVGENGADGKDGANGADGKDGVDGANGADGADGCYYVPNEETGYFDIYNADGTLKESTTISWQGSGITAVETETDVILHNVTLADGTQGDVTLSKTNNLRSLVFIPEVYVDGVQGMLCESFTYNALTLNDKDSKNEEAEEAETETVVNVTVIAKYHVNPTSANIDELKDNMSFVIDDKPYYSTRAAASEDFEAVPEYMDFSDGVLTVKVNITGTPAIAEEDENPSSITVLALQVAKENGETVTSDYATVYKKELSDLAIADDAAVAKKKDITTGDEHYRTLIDGEDTDAYLNNVKVWSDQDNGVEVDASFVYTESLNLYDIVAAHEVDEDGCVSTVAANLDKLGLAWNFEVVENYDINGTPQDEFITLSDGVLTARVYDATNGLRAAIGRTPIIRVTLVDTNNNNAIVKVAYIKVRIVDTDEVIEDQYITLDVDPFTFACGEDVANAVTVKEINVKIYNELGLSFEQFRTNYPTFVDYGVTESIEGTVGTVDNTPDNNLDTETDVITWTITNDELWENAGTTLTHVIRYYNEAGNFVQFNLTSSVEDIQKTYDLDATKYINNYWDANKKYAKFNVSVPLTTSDDDPTNCLFINDLNSPFVTWSAADGVDDDEVGVIALDKAVSKIEYYFCEDVSKITEIGGHSVTFEIRDDGTTLYVTEFDGETEDALIATIDNSGNTTTTSEEAISNAITYNKEETTDNTTIAKILLNTGKMYTYIGATGYVCGETDRPVSITFKGEDHYIANFIRPVNIAAVSAGNFIDGVDFGEAGSYIDLEDLISPYDWRDRYFSDYANYWDYYGPFTIDVDLDSAMCDLNAEGSTAKSITLATGETVNAIAVPTTLVLNQTERNATMGGKTAEQGFLTYKNNGTTVNTAFNIYVKVTVDYGWGEIVTDYYITIPVASTVNQ